VTSPPASDHLERRVALAAIFLLHVAAVAALIHARVTPPEKLPQVLRATLIVPKPPPPEAPPPRTPLPQAKPQPTPMPRAQPLPAPVLAAPATAPSPIAAPPATITPAAVAVTPVPVAAPIPLTPPRFDADYLDNPKPAYPPAARRLGEEGKVVVRVFVEPDGRPGKLEVQRSSGASRLDDAALSTVSRWKFVPARQGGEAVGAWVLVPITFKLEN